MCYFARDFNIKSLQIIPMIFHLLDSVCHQKFLKTIVFLTCSTEPLQLVTSYDKIAPRSDHCKPQICQPRNADIKPAVATRSTVEANTPLKTTPPKFNITPEKLPSQKVSSLPGASIFRGYVKLLVGNSLPLKMFDHWKFGDSELGNFHHNFRCEMLVRQGG